MPEAEELMMIGFDNLEDLVSFVKKVERRRITTSMAVENREVLEIYMVPDIEILKNRERYLEHREKVTEIFKPFHVKLALHGTREIVDIYKKYVLEDSAESQGKEIDLPKWVADAFPEFCRGGTWLANRMYAHVCSPIGAWAPVSSVAKAHHVGEELTSKMDLKDVPYTDEPARIKRVMIPLERGTLWEIEWDACIDHDDPKKNQRFIMELMLRCLSELNCSSVVSAPMLELAQDPAFVTFMRKIKEICDPNRILERGYSR
jgi:hypothetical protein